MKKTFLAALAVLLLLPLTASTQSVVYEVKGATMALNYDLDGEAADDNQVVEAATGVLVDNGTSVANANYTITAQPDTCRFLNTTIVDTNLSAGVLTVVGTGCLDEPKTCSFTFTAADNSGVKNLSCVGGESAYFKTVDTITTGNMTGESDESFTLGYASVNSVNGLVLYGTKTTPGPNGENGVNPFGDIAVGKKITTAGLSGTTIAGVTASDDPFALVSAGDLLLFNVNGYEYERKVVTWGNADSVVVNAAVTIPATGVTFRYKKQFFSTNPLDQLAIPVKGYTSALFTWSVAANANTGGVITLVECTTSDQPNLVLAPWTQISTTTVASGATKAATVETINLLFYPYSYCRFGIRFGTGDDGDGAAEDISIRVDLVR